MISILVCHSYFLRFDPKQAERGKPYPPLATLQVAAMLRQAGHQVALFDAMLADGLEEYEAKLEATRPQVVLLYEDNFNFLSKMCLGKMREAACWMIGRARHAGARVIASGPDVSDAPETYLRAGADITLKGEGLTALMELVPRLDAGLNAPAGELIQGVSGAAAGGRGDMLVKVSGVRFLPANAEIGVTSKGAPATAEVGTTQNVPTLAEAAATASLPRLPDATASATTAAESAATTTSIPQIEMAAWDLVDMDRYRAVWMRSHGYFSLNMAASRGCSFRCTWCAKPIWGNQYLQRSAASVAAEMAYLRRTFNPGHIWFADDIFGFRVDWVNEFAAAVAAAGGGIPFTIQTRADLLSERMATALADAGCKEAWLGAESGSQRILDAMNKGTTLGEIITARGRLQASGVRVGFFIQLGYLDEQLPDILATRQLLETARPDDVGVSVSYPLPGTKFHELVKAQLRGKTHWQDSDDLAMMFQGTYTSEFYRAIRNLIHEQVTLQIREKDVPASEKSPARKALERRWHKLLRRESLYRSPAGGTSAAVTAYESRAGAGTGTAGHRSAD